jgi:hypothetical protein
VRPPVTEPVLRLRGGAIGLEVETGFELGGLEDADGYPTLITAPEYSLVVDRTPAVTGPNAGRIVPIIEIVMQPINTLDGETGWLDRVEAFRALPSVLDRLHYARRGTTIAEIFSGVPGAVVHRYARRATLLRDADPRRTYTQFNVGVPMSGVRELLQTVARRARMPAWVTQGRTASALAFGDEVAALFARTERTGGRRTADSDVATVRNYGTLVYTQVAAMLDGILSAPDLLRRHAMIASRTPLGELRRSLPRGVRRFLTNEAAAVRSLFRDLYGPPAGVTLPHNPHVPASGDLLAVEWNQEVAPGTMGPAHAIGDYLDNALMTITDPARLIDQWDSLGVTTQLPKMDDNFGQRRSDPLVVLEIRSFGAAKHESRRELSADYDRLERMARHADRESAVLQQLDQVATTGLEVRFAEGRRTDPDWGPPGVLDRFGDSVGRLVVGRRAAGRGALSVQVEGGGNGGLLSNAHTTGLNRADAVIEVLRRHIGPILRSLGLPEDAVAFIRSSRGNRDTSGYPFPQTEGRAEERRRRVHVWIDPGGRRPATGQAHSEASTSREAPSAPGSFRARRLRGGALGFEVETRPIVQLRPGADAQRFRIDARDGSLSVVLDNKWYYLATDQTLHRSAAALEKAGKALEEKVRAEVLEIVTAPVAVVPGDAGRADGGNVLERVEEVISGLRRLGDGQAIERIFPAERFAYSDEARGAFVHPGPPGMPFDFLVHFTAGVPIVRMHEFLSGARDHTMPVSARDHLVDGLTFGNEIAARYARTLPGLAGHRIPPYAVHLLAGRADVSAVRGFLALVYAQVAPIVHGRPGQNVALKVRAAAASRTSLAGIRATLPDPVRTFLEHHAADIQETLVQRMRQRRPEIRGTAPLSLRGLERSPRTIGEYLATALLPGRPPIDQGQALGVNAHFDGPDINEGRLEPPLVLVELRRLGDRAYSRQTAEGLKLQYELVVSLARRAYTEARAIEVATPTAAVRHDAVTLPDLAMFRDTEWAREIDWVLGIRSVLATAWHLDPVLRGGAGANAVITEAQVGRIIRATSAMLSGDHGHVEELAGDLSGVLRALRELAGRVPDTVRVMTPALEAAESVLTHLDLMGSPSPLAEPGQAGPEGDRRDLVVDEELVAEVNRRLAVFGRRWTGGRVDAARIRAALDALPPSQVFGPATDIAFQIVRAGR